MIGLRLVGLSQCQECFKDQGSKSLRRLNNAALLRCFAALQRGKEAVERMKVALTMCETKEVGLKCLLRGMGRASD